MSTVLYSTWWESGFRFSLLTGQLPLSHLYEGINRVRETHSDVIGPCNNKQNPHLADILCKNYLCAWFCLLLHCESLEMFLL